jgi:hypothetical protein
MTQVKIFSSTNNNENGLENQINIWLRENPNIEITGKLQSQSGRYDRQVVITIFYKCLER